MATSPANTCGAPTTRGGRCGRPLRKGTFGRGGKPSGCYYHGTRFTGGQWRPGPGLSAAGQGPPVVLLLAEPDDIPSAELAPHVRLNGTDFEIVRHPDTGLGCYTLLGPNGGAHYMRPIIESGLETAMLWVNDGRKNLRDEDERPLLLAEDGDGGLTLVRRFSPQWRTHMNEALAAVGKPPKTEPARSGSTTRLEVPLTRGEWVAAAAELQARLVTRADGGPATLVTAVGDLSVIVRDDNFEEPLGMPSPAALLEVSGKLTIGRSTYSVRGNPEWPRVRNEAGDRCVSGEREAQVARIVKSAWDADGEHAQMRDLAGAATGAATTSYAVNDDREVYPPALQARACLLRLGTVDLPASARTVALAMTESDFTGTVQDLRDVAHAVSGE